MQKSIGWCSWISGIIICCCRRTTSLMPMLLPQFLLLNWAHCNRLGWLVACSWCSVSSSGSFAKGSQGETLASQVLTFLCVAAFGTNDPQATRLPGQPGLAGVNGGKTPAAEKPPASHLLVLWTRRSWFKCHLNYFPSLIQGCDSSFFFFERLDELEPHL